MMMMMGSDTVVVTAMDTKRYEWKLSTTICDSFQAIRSDKDPFCLVLFHHRKKRLCTSGGIGILDARSPSYLALDQESASIYWNLISRPNKKPIAFNQQSSAIWLTGAKEHCRRQAGPSTDNYLGIFKRSKARTVAKMFLKRYFNQPDLVDIHPWLAE